MKPKVRLREMTAEDAAAVHAIEVQVSIEPWSERLFHDCVQVGYSCWVFEGHRSIIGFGLLSCAAGEAHVLNLGISPQHQGKGLGKRMMRHLIRKAKILGGDVLYLEVRDSNKVAKALYQKLSFIEVGVRQAYYPTKDGREDAIVLALSLVG